MPARLDQLDAGEQFGVAVYQPIAQVRVVPERERGVEARIAAARQGAVLPLDDEFRPREGGVLARVVRVEMGADEDVDVVGAQAEVGEVRDDILVDLDPHLRGGLDIGGEPGVNQDVGAVAQLNQVAGDRHRLAAGMDGRHLHQIESSRGRVGRHRVTCLSGFPGSMPG